MWQTWGLDSEKTKGNQTTKTAQKNTKTPPNPLLSALVEACLTTAQKTNVWEQERKTEREEDRETERQREKADTLRQQAIR